MRSDSSGMQDSTGLEPLYSEAQIRAVETAAQATLPPHALMLRAAEAAATLAMRLIAQQAVPVAIETGTRPSCVLIAAGTGNNGGDALECAVLLAGRGCAVTVLMPVPPALSASSNDHRLALENMHALGDSIECLHGIAVLDALTLRSWDLVIDGLFGIGLTRSLADPWQAVVAMLNSIDSPLLALDVPSGLDADTGTIRVDPVSGQRGACIRASHTLTFIGDKPGLRTGSGREYAGHVTIAALDIDPTLFPTPTAVMNGPAAFPQIGEARRQDSHKGTYGDVVVIGGASGMAGAAILAAQAALKSGCGRVTIGFAEQGNAPAVIPGQPELMCRSAVDVDLSTATCVVGPGLGQSPAAIMLVERACDAMAPLVLDADALNLAAASTALAARVASRRGPTLMTPHPLEAARLLGVSVAAIESDRLGAAGEIARRFCAVVILKGSGTIITDGQQILVNPTGNPALATGGTGDALAGICGALLAQGWLPMPAAAGAVWLHGAAADWLVGQGIGPIGVTASEIIDAARIVRNRMSSKYQTLQIMPPAPAGRP